jgi:CRP-like cAMP-binding protein
LLSAVSIADYELLRPHLEPVQLKLRQSLERPNRRIDNVYFIHAGIASVVALQAGPTQAEVGLIGYEGMSGSAVLLGDDRSPHSTYMQIAGDGERIAVAALDAAVGASRTLRAVLLRYVQSFLVQTAQTAIANARNRLDARLARWILMAHDRVPRSTLPLTHELLALMLAVRRAGVTEAVHALARSGLIHASRGQIVIVDRAGLERRAGTAYGLPESEYRRLIR